MATITACEPCKVWVLGKPHTDKLRDSLYSALIKFLSTMSELGKKIPSEEMGRTVSTGVLVKMMKGEEVMCRGESALTVGIVVKGAIELRGQTKPCPVFTEGDHFGDKDMMADESRQSTAVVASNEAVVFMLNKELFDIINTYGSQPQLSPLAQECLSKLRTFPELERIQSKRLRRMAADFKPKMFGEGEVCLSGTVPEYVGIVTKGSLVLETEGKGSTVLKEGDTFNQSALAHSSGIASDV